MKILAAPMLVVVFVFASLTGWKLYVQQDTYVVGGDYVLHAGEVVSGNLRALFAQVTLEDGARVEGRILALSSTLDLNGKVNGSILALGSDITMRETAVLAEGPRRVELLPYVILLPRMARMGQAAMQVQ